MRDQGLLESALAQPEAGFGDSYLHEDIFAMASAYLFHPVKNHPFLDGNKRIGFSCAWFFLLRNGYRLEQHDSIYIELTLGMPQESSTRPTSLHFSESMLRGSDFFIG